MTVPGSAESATAALIMALMSAISSDFQAYS